MFANVGRPCDLVGCINTQSRLVGMGSLNPMPAIERESNTLFLRQTSLATTHWGPTLKCPISHTLWWFKFPSRHCETFLLYIVFIVFSSFSKCVWNNCYWMFRKQQSMNQNVTFYDAVLVIGSPKGKTGNVPSLVDDCF